MAETVFHHLADFFAHYGYWTVFFGVMVENAGLPVPGETILLFSGFLAYHGHLNLWRAILTAIAGATLGDNLGYLIGRWGGTKLLRRLRGKPFFPARQFDSAQAALQRYGHWAVFAARFITGLRVLAGPFAGAFLMPYPRFLIANFSGAVLWAAVIGYVGFAFGGNWPRIVRLVKEADIVTLIAVAAAVIVWIVWRRKGKGQAAGDK